MSTEARHAVPALADEFSALAGHAKISETGLRFVGQILYEQWAECGDTLMRFEQASRWWLGDWFLHGEDAFPEHAQALPDDSYRQETLRQYAWVASRVDPVTRVTFSTLPWALFRLVASLDTLEQQELLKAARDGRWTCRDLREAVRIFKRQLTQEKARGDARRLAHVAREYGLELDQIRSVLGPLVRSADDPSLERLHEGVKDSIRRVIEHCTSGAAQAPLDQSGDEGADTCAERRLVVGSDWTPDERGVEHVCPDCRGGMGEYEALCDTCQYAADERAGMRVDT